MSQQHAVVLGGGIGGLTTAVALHRRAWHVTVLERAPSIDPVGAGIALAPNGQRALDVIGLGDEIRALAAWQGSGGLRTPRGRWLTRLDAEAVTERFGGPLVLLHRADLIARLAAALPPDRLRTDSPAELVAPGVPGAARAVVRTPDGDLHADLVVAADGIRSATRRVLFPEHPGPRYSGFTTWRFVAPDPGRPFAPHETWGRGSLWGAHPLADGRVYAYAAALAPAGTTAPDEHAELRRRFADWHDPVPALLGAAARLPVLRHDVHHMTNPLPALHRGRVVLVGDAAHAMAPMLAQGGNQAIEDGIVLAHHADPTADLRSALAAYTADRLPRTDAIVRKAAGVARIVALSSRPAVALRTAALALTSQLMPDAMLRGFTRIADWNPPGDPYASERPTRTT
ncbi:FAD-dependent monooxygenase [Streptomyces sp. NPDC059816]|uniref:FAD-dependent monooxygenase n=1 Tax=Streptomyces sp. NPDC059816 TaxID=3346960 RepID=UPI003651585B